MLGLGEIDGAREPSDPFGGERSLLYNFPPLWLLFVQVLLFVVVNCCALGIEEEEGSGSGVVLDFMEGGDEGFEMESDGIRVRVRIKAKVTRKMEGEK